VTYHSSLSSISGLALTQGSFAPWPLYQSTRLNIRSVGLCLSYPPVLGIGNTGQGAVPPSALNKFSRVPTILRTVDIPHLHRSGNYPGQASHFRETSYYFIAEHGSTGSLIFRQVNPDGKFRFSTSRVKYSEAKPPTSIYF